MIAGEPSRRDLRRQSAKLLRPRLAGPPAGSVLGVAWTHLGGRPVGQAGINAAAAQLAGDRSGAEPLLRPAARVRARNGRVLDESDGLQAVELGGDNVGIEAPAPESLHELCTRSGTRVSMRRAAAWTAPAAPASVTALVTTPPQTSRLHLVVDLVRGLRRGSPMPSCDLILVSTSAGVGLSRRKPRAFSRPCPSWSPS